MSIADTIRAAWRRIAGRPAPPARAAGIEPETPWPRGPDTVGQAHVPTPPRAPRPMMRIPPRPPTPAPIDVPHDYLAGGVWPGLIVGTSGDAAPAGPAAPEPEPVRSGGGGDFGGGGASGDWTPAAPEPSPEPAPSPPADPPASTTND